MFNMFLRLSKKLQDPRNIWKCKKFKDNKIMMSKEKARTTSYGRVLQVPWKHTIVPRVLFGYNIIQSSSQTHSSVI
jgi:hypothetical protein